MKHHLFRFTFIILVLFNFNLNAQFFSESPVTISEKGERLSQMIYLKLNLSDFAEIPTGKRFVDGNSISGKFLIIHKVISDFCKERQINLSELKICKAIPAA
jgi:hypothetical protein